MQIQGLVRLRKSLFVAACLASLALAFTACGSSNSSSSSSSGGSGGEGEKELGIGAPLTLSGPAAPFGEGEQNGMELAAKQQEEEGGLKINFDVQDDGGDQAKAVTIAQEYIADDSIDAVVGQTASTSAVASLTALGKAEMPTLFLLPETPEASTGDAVYRITSPEYQYMQKLVDVMKENGVKRIATIYDNSNPTFIADQEAMKPLLEKAGIEEVATEASTSETTDFQPLLTKIADSGAEALEIGVTGSTNLTIIKQAREAGLDFPIYAHDGLGVPSLVDQLGPSSGEVYFASQFSYLSEEASAQEFVKAFEKAYGTPPDPYAAAAYDAINVLAQIARERDEVSRESITEGLANLGSFDGVRGSFEFSPERDAVGTELGVITKVENGKPELLEG